MMIFICSKPNSYFEEHALVKVWVLDYFALFAGVQDDKSGDHLREAAWMSARKVSEKQKKQKTKRAKTETG